MKSDLDHTADFSPEEHGKFREAFRIFKEKTDFESQDSPIMLKYYVQMAFLEGWKRVINDRKDPEKPPVEICVQGHCDRPDSTPR